MVKALLGIPHGQTLDEVYVRIRVFDSEREKVVLWEDESGAVHGDAALLSKAGSGSDDVHEDETGPFIK